MLFKSLNRCFSVRKLHSLRRAMMYVPGNDQKKISKIFNLSVDSVVLDCEDGVAINKKEEARKSIVALLDTADASPFPHTECCVRINSIDSNLASADLEALSGARTLPPTILVPKVDTVAHVEWIADKLNTNFAKQNHKFGLIIYMESAISLLNLKDICLTALKLKEKAPFVLEGIVFGSDDYCANVGATRSDDGAEISFARQYMLTVCKAFGLQAIDMVHINFKDLEGLRKQCIDGMRMGYTGKQVIHPGQVPIVQEAFSPSKEKIQWAKQLIKEFGEHQKGGKGAFVFQGSMIDMPLLLQAQNIVNLANKMQAP